MKEKKHVKFGWAGLGNIGSVMAGLLIKDGYPMIVHDLRREAGEKLVSAGAQGAGTPQEVAEKADTIVPPHKL
jgi:3-hydroxyisobutyrate dehydrogenase-like beta-hydroxyacid dehydrogenase